MNHALKSTLVEKYVTFFCRFDRKFGNESRLEIDIGGEICNFFFVVLTENLEINHALRSTSGDENVVLVFLFNKFLRDQLPARSDFFG